MCLKIHEEIHGMTEKPVVVCHKCGSECFKLISINVSNIFAASVPLYDFVDHKTTTSPVRIKSKRQWNEHLKRVGQYETSNEAPTKQHIESAERSKKWQAKRELRETIVKAVTDKKHIQETKEKILNSRKGR